MVAHIANDTETATVFLFSSTTSDEQAGQVNQEKVFRDVFHFHSRPGTAETCFLFRIAATELPAAHALLLGLDRTINVDHDAVVNLNCFSSADREQKHWHIGMLQQPYSRRGGSSAGELSILKVSVS